MNNSERTQINHTEYPKTLKALSVPALMFRIKDCREAIEAMPNGHKAGYYQDEIHYCAGPQQLLGENSEHFRTHRLD